MENMQKLEVELNEMVKADDLYWLRNEAKCRAARNHVSYEEFEKLVKTSHLKPLGKGDHLNVNVDKVTIWNSLSSSKVAQQVCRQSVTCHHPEAAKPIEDCIQESSKKNATRGENEKRHKKKVANAAGPVTLQLISSTLQRISKDQDISAESIIQNLRHLSNRPRFDLEIAMASNEEKTVLNCHAQKIWDDLIARDLHNQEELDMLFSHKYECVISKKP